MTVPLKERYDLIDLAIKQGALRFGEFTLKSGRTSPYFFNVGEFNTGEALYQLGACYARAIVGLGVEFDCLLGLAYKGIPLVTATTISLFKDYKRSVYYCFNRKEVKDHGEKGIIIGGPLRGRVLIIDDVISAGTSFRQAMELVKQYEHNDAVSVVGMVVSMDRMEKMDKADITYKQSLEAIYNVPIEAIFSLDDLIEYFKKQGEDGLDTANLLAEYGTAAKG